MAPRIRVLHVLCGTAFAGTEKHVLALATQLRLLGCDSEIACSRAARELTAGAVQAMVPVRSLSRLRRGLAPDVVHVHDGRAALLGRVLATDAGTALVRTQHFVRPASTERRGALGWLSVSAHRLINRRVDGYISVSAAAARAAEARREIRCSATAIISPGVAVPLDSELEAGLAARRSSARPIVLSAGRLEPERRFDVLLDAVPDVLRQVPDCEFLIAGGGSAEAALRARAHALGVGHAIRWAGWVTDLGGLMAGAHVYVNTWPFEGFGMATAEAMAFALPVVATNTGASPELVDDRVTGRLVAPADPAALTRALLELLTDPVGSEAMGAAGRERALSGYSTRATAQATLAFYAELPRLRRGR